MVTNQIWFKKKHGFALPQKKLSVQLPQAVFLFFLQKHYTESCDFFPELLVNDQLFSPN